MLGIHSEHFSPKQKWFSLLFDIHQVPDTVPELDADDWNFVLSGDEDRWAPPSFPPVPEMDCAQLLGCDMGYFGAMH